MDDLQQLKHRAGLSNQEISELSGVPIATVQRILAGTCKNPGYENVAAIRDVLKQHIPDHGPMPQVDALATSADIDRLAAQYRETIDRIEAQFSAALASKDVQFERERETHAGRMKVKERWLVRLSIACSVLMLFIMTVLIVDMANPNVGWFRSAYLRDAISNVWGEVAATLTLIFSA